MICLKIAFVINDCFGLGGAQRVTCVVATMLSNQGFDVDIICTKPRNQIDYSKYNLSKDVNIIPLGQRPFLYKMINVPCKALRVINTKTDWIKRWSRLKKYIYYTHDQYILDDLTKIIQKNKYDVVIGVEGIDYMPLALIKDKIEAKVYGWQHSSTEAYFKTKGLFYYNQEELFSEYLKKLDAYIVLTQHDKKEIDALYNINSTVISNPKSFVSNEQSSLEKKVFISVGRYEKIKGYDLLIDSFQMFSKNNADWILRIVGEGSEHKNLENQIKKYHLENRVFLVPATKNVKEELLKASVFLSSSRIEGFPLVLIEAFEVGLPVVGYALPFMYDLIEQGKNGMIVDRFDKEAYARTMLEITKNQEKLKEYGQSAKKRNERFSQESIYKKWKEILVDKRV